MSRSTQRRKSTNGNDNQHVNVNCEVSQLLPKELEEHKTINNKDGIEWSLHAVRRSCGKPACESVWERKIQTYDQYQRSHSPTPKGTPPEREPGKTNANNGCCQEWAGVRDS